LTRLQLLISGIHPIRNSVTRGIKLLLQDVLEISYDSNIDVFCPADTSATPYQVTGLGRNNER
jgi:hypothetical protein